MNLLKILLNAYPNNIKLYTDNSEYNFNGPVRSTNGPVIYSNGMISSVNRPVFRLKIVVIMVIIT